MRIGRRQAMLGALVACACSKPSGTSGVVRVGFQANLTNAPVLAGVASGRIAKALGATSLETRVLRAGPRVIEAMLGEAIDFGICGPAAIVGAKAHYGDGLLRIVSGCASGGASFVVSPALASRGNFRGKTLATPQVGSTQDVALRKWLRSNGKEGVRITQLAGSSILWAMKKGDVDGAWLPEPWATRLVEEAGATRLVDERDEWQARSFASAVVVVRKAFYEARRPEADALTQALREEVLRPASDEAYDYLGKLTHNAGPKKVWDLAWQRVDFTTDPLRESIAAFARDVASLGILPATDVSSLFVSEPA